MIKAGVVLLCGTVLVAGCGGKSPPADAAKPNAAPSAPAAAAKKAAASAGENIGMVNAVGIVKSTVPVAVKFGLGSRPKLGEPLAIDLAVVPQIAADSAVIQVAESDGLDTSAVGAGVPLDKVEAGGSYKRSISVTPTKSGVLLLALQVTIKHDEISESRPFLVPIIVADAAPAAALSLVTPKPP
jgi:hypothetical protein